MKKNLPVVSVLALPKAHLCQLNIAADGVALVLRHSRHHGKDKITGGVIRADVLLLEDDRDSKSSKPLGIPLAVRHVARESGNAFADDDVQLFSLGIHDHLLESRSIFDFRCRAPVSVDFDQFPVRVVLDHLRVVLLLGLKALVLVFTQSADTAVRRHTLFRRFDFRHHLFNNHLLQLHSLAVRHGAFICAEILCRLHGRVPLCLPRIH